MTEERKHLSVSQKGTYERCPYSYYLYRVKKVWQRPAAWLPQGTAVHEAAEYFERSGRNVSLQAVREVFSDSYESAVNDMLEITPNMNWWFASGPYTAVRDIPRRHDIGLEQTAKYLTWYETHPEEVIWFTPDGEPAIELGFDIDLDGVQIRGFIDAVIQTGHAHNPGGEIITVRDNKTGNNPGDDFQLGVYAVAVAESFGVEAPAVGDYWMGRSGKPTHPYDLTAWPRDRVVEVFHELRDNIDAERFPPLPDPDKCRFCSVKDSCQYRAD